MPHPMSDNKIPRRSLFATLTMAMLLSLSCNHDLSNGHQYGRLYPITQGDAWGWIDSVGNVVVAPNPKFSSTGFFCDGAGFIVERPYRLVLYNSRLQRVWESDHATNRTAFHGGYAVVLNGIYHNFDRVVLDAEGHELNRIHTGFDRGLYPEYVVERGFAWPLQVLDDESPTDIAGHPIQIEGYEIDRCNPLPSHLDPYAVMDRPMTDSIFVRDNLVRMRDRASNRSTVFTDLNGVPKEGDFDDCECFSEGLAVSRGVWGVGFVNQEGRMVIADTFYDASAFSEGLAAVQLKWHPNRMGYINHEGEMVLAAEYFFAGQFKEGLAYVHRKSDGWRGYINHQGEQVVSLPEDVPMKDSGLDHPFEHGLAKFWLPEKQYLLIDKAGKKVTKIPGDPRKYYWDEYLIYVDGSWMNHKGEWVWRPQ